MSFEVAGACNECGAVIHTDMSHPSLPPILPDGHSFENRNTDEKTQERIVCPAPKPGWGKSAEGKVADYAELIAKLQEQVAALEAAAKKKD